MRSENDDVTSTGLSSVPKGASSLQQVKAICLKVILPLYALDNVHM